jgi:hypothetical protein
MARAETVRRPEMNKTFKIARETKRTDKAILVDLKGVNDLDSIPLGRADVWLPLSQITIDNGIVTLPAWLAEKKGLCW